MISPASSLVSVIVPAMNEADNIPVLLPRLSAAFAGRPYEVIIVDDNSKDSTPQVCAELEKSYPLRLIVRQQPTHGLSGAVLQGIAESEGDTIVVMDADLQHPPESVPQLIAELDADADFALGSRYVQGGSTDHEWTFFRKINSDVATFLARPFAGKVLDPMSGFFALRRSTFDRAERLTPLGYKIALELMCKCRVRRVREVPIHFALRTRGESKLSIKQQFRYLEHLSRLYDFTYPRASPIVKFLIALLLSFVCSLGVYFSLLYANDGRVSATALAYFVAILFTAVFHIRYVRTQREFLVTRHPWKDFTVISALEWMAAVSTAKWLVARAPHSTAAEAFCISFCVATAVRYILRKEFLQDIRGLRSQPRDEILQHDRPL